MFGERRPLESTVACRLQLARRRERNRERRGTYRAKSHVKKGTLYLPFFSDDSFIPMGGGQTRRIHLPMDS